MVKKEINNYQDAITDYEQAIKFLEQKYSSHSPDPSVYYNKGI